MDEGLGARFWLAVVGICIAVGIGAMLLFLFMTAAWYRWGFLGAFIFFGAILLFIAWLYDRRQVKRYEDLT
jgi:hypothetical protein